MERRREDERRYQQDLETEYEWYCNSETERYINSLTTAEVETIHQAKRQENREKYKSLSPQTIDEIAQQEVRRELRKRAPLLTLDDFKARREQGSALSPEPVSNQIVAELVSSKQILEPPSASSESSENSALGPTITEPPVIATNPPAMPEERGEAENPARGQEPATAAPQAAIERTAAPEEPQATASVPETASAVAPAKPEHPTPAAEEQEPEPPFQAHLL